MNRECPMNWPQPPVEKVLKRYILRYQPIVVQDRKNKSTGKMGFGLGWSAAAVIKFTLQCWWLEQA
jgi:hypothetical protein